MHKRLTKGQVLMGAVGFILLMGIVGKIDHDSMQATIDEKTSIRDQIKAAQEEDAKRWLAHYESQVRR